MKKTVFRIALSGAMIALAFALSFVKIPGLPYGGSVTLFSMVPIVFVGCVYGMGWGLIAGFVYSLLQLFQSAVFSQSFAGQNAVGVILMLLFDFILAFTVIGLGGMFINKKNITSKAAPFLAAGGAAIVCFGRYICHTISGFILFGDYAEWFFTDVFTNDLGKSIMTNFSGKTLALIYSAIYNALYMVPEIIITAAGIAVIMGIVMNIEPMKKRIVSERNKPIFGTKEAK